MIKLKRLTKLRGAKSHTRPPFILGAYLVEYIVVGGGGGGGGAGGAGGGGGGFRKGTKNMAMRESAVCTIGNGGDGVTNGTASEVFAISAAGGGGAAIYSERAGLNGGCGGGGHMQHGAHSISRANGVGNTPSTNPSQGYDGAYGQLMSNYYAGGGGGGGGGGGNGGNSSSGRGGNGGQGAEWPTGSGVYYAGGGGGAGLQSGAAGPGDGGSGGGAPGTAPEASPTAAQNGQSNTGGGGGGSGSGNYSLGGTGGSGVVIIRYIGFDELGVGGRFSIFNGYATHTVTNTGTYYG